MTTKPPLKIESYEFRKWLEQLFIKIKAIEAKLIELEARIEALEP